MKRFQNSAVRGGRTALAACALMAGLAAGCGGGSGASSPMLPPPSNLSYASPLAAPVGTAITPQSPSVTGSVASYSVNPPLPPGLSLNVSTGVISGTPTVTTVESAYVITASNATGSTAFTLSIAIVSPGRLALSADSLTFGDQLPSTSSGAQTIAVINLGQTTLGVNGIAISGSAAGSFAETDTCGSLAAGGTCLIQVTFTPPAAGSQSASLQVSTDAGNGTVQLFGNGVVVALSFDPAIVPAGQMATLTWSAPTASACNGSGSWSGAEPASGSQSITQSSPGYYTYSLTCTVSGNPVTNSTVLTAYGATPTVSEPAHELGYQADFYVAPPNAFAALQTTITVPPLPPVPTTQGAALFLWPGLDPATGSANFQPINNGVLQPVLSWGPSCAPTPQPSPFTSWWISGQYVNTFGKDAGYSGCFSGNSLLVSPGDVLLLHLSLAAGSGVWTETVTDAKTSESVAFSIAMQGQGQNWAYWAMEFWYGATIQNPVAFRNTVITFASPDTAGWCSASQGATNAYIYTPPTSLSSSTQCFLGSTVLTQPP